MGPLEQLVQQPLEQLVQQPLEQLEQPLLQQQQPLQLQQLRQQPQLRPQQHLQQQLQQPPQQQQRPLLPPNNLCATECFLTVPKSHFCVCWGSNLTNFPSHCIYQQRGDQTSLDPNTQKLLLGTSKKHPVESRRTVF